MAEVSNIEWCDATVNFWWGCTKVSAGCANCYADTLSNRFGKDIWGPGKPREDHRKGATKLAYKLNAKAEKEGRRLRVFSASMSDWLDAEVPVEWRADMLDVIRQTPEQDWLLLSKRPQDWEERLYDVVAWLGTSVENQEAADKRIPELLKIPARVRFLSCEPLLGPVDLSAWVTYVPADSDHEREPVNEGIHWVICGGESGANARPMHPDWARSLRDQCAAAGVPFLFKQWGEWALWDRELSGKFDVASMCPQSCGATGMQKVGKKAAGRLLDGVEHNRFPEVNV